MKKYWIIVLVLLLFTGCGHEEPMETVGDEWLIPANLPTAEMVIALPEDAAEQAMSGENGARLYFCDGYSLSVQTLPGGDLERSLQSLCGYGSEELTLLKTRSAGCRRFDWVWTSVGEGGDQIGRAALLDDGIRHYCVSVMADASRAGELEERWDPIFASLSLADQSP